MRNLSGEAYAATKYNTFTVKEQCTLTEFLQKQMSGISHNRLKDILKGRGVSVDRKIVTQYDYQLQPGMTVQISKHRRSTELQNKWVKIVYEDKDIVVIEKNVGILSMAATAKQFCVKTVLDEYFTKRHFKCHAHVVHRLDRDTSGLMIYAKTIEAARILESDWKDMVYDRRYVAVLQGKMDLEGGTIKNWLTDNKAFVTFASETDNGGKFAVTHFHTLKTTEKYSLVELRLETGRKNQIRVHMQGLGHPVIGDPKYGIDGEYMPNPLGRLCLHAYRLFFYHPITGQPMQFETPFPTAFRNLVEDRNEQDTQE